MILTQKDFTYQINDNNYTIIQGSNVISGLLDNESAKLAQEQIQELINVQILINNSIYPLNDVKQAYINLSKTLLEEYLSNNPLKSDVHGEDKYYSVTSQKQTLLTEEILVCEMAAKNNLDYTPTWNATGEIATNDWTIEELQQLAYEITMYVKPLILQQQIIETQLKECQSVEEILNIKISYERS